MSFFLADGILQRSNPAAMSQVLPSSDDIRRAELPNGIVLLSRANHNSPSVVVRGYLPVGGLFDPDEKLGLANFTASALMRGTARRTFQQIFADLEAVGANLGVNSATHTTGFGGRALVEDLDLMLDTLAEVLRRPVFPSEQIARLRAHLMTSLAIRSQDTGDMASLTFDQIVYKGHPYSRPDEGYPGTIQAIQQEDLVDFHKQLYRPSGMVVAIVGAVEPREAVDRIARSLGDWWEADTSETFQLPDIEQLQATQLQRVTIPGKVQADIVMGTAGPPRTSPDYLAASLGNNVLGQFGMMGRIGKIVREEAGLAYYASSSLNGGLGPGPWEVLAGVHPEHVDRVIDLIRDEIRRFVNMPISDEELADSKANFIGRLPLSLESNVGVAAALLNLERYNLGLDYYVQFSDLVGAIDADQVLDVAQRYLDPDRLGIAIAGP